VPKTEKTKTIIIGENPASIKVNIGPKPQLNLK